MQEDEDVAILAYFPYLCTFSYLPFCYNPDDTGLRCVGKKVSCFCWT
jgi:hypothetical protein